MDAVEIVVRGRVQGVGYRMWARDTAQALGLSGVVRNQQDGSVQAVVTGPPERIDAFAAACRAGPPEAAVEMVERRPAPDGPASEGTGMTIADTA